MTTRKCPTGRNGRHNYQPDDTDDGYWYCACGARVETRFDLPPVDPAAAHVLADIKGTGLRSVR